MKIEGAAEAAPLLYWKKRFIILVDTSIFYGMRNRIG